MDVTLFSPHFGQKRVIDGFADSEHKFGVVATGRQYGKSLLAQNLMIYWLLNTPNQKGAWITPVYNQCKKIFAEMISSAYPLIKNQNKADLTIEFINGSTLQFLSTDNYNTIRGFSFNYMVIDEAAFIKEDAINEAILPTLTVLGKKCLIISTPKSKNWFYNWYIRGLTPNNNYISFQGISSSNPYVDKEFITEQEKSLPPEIFRQEFLAEFTDAGSDVFTGVDNVCILDEYDAKRNRRCYIGVDTGINGDYTVCTVLDETGKTLGILRVNGGTFQSIGDNILSYLDGFNVIGGFCETNGIGLAMYQILKPKIHKLQSFNTTNTNKVDGIRNLIQTIQNQDLVLPSKTLFPELYNELNAFTYKISSTGLIQFSAPSGLHDDCIMSLMLANEARTKQLFTKSKIYIGQSTPKNNSRIGTYKA